ncbi:MAG: hypothetical protein ACYCST_20255 [Acidimicrobiales bacterium]
MDIPVLAAQLGLLPDLRYLVDGLQRSLACVRDHGADLDACLRAVPGRRLEPEALAEAIAKLIAWSGQQAWADDDPRVLPMAVVLDQGADDILVDPQTPVLLADPQESTASGPARAAHGIRHPLAGYCLSVAFHWSNLFYTLEPAAALTLPEEGGAAAYGELMAEFSAYVLAAQSTIEADAYMAFVAEWWATDRLPTWPLYPDRRLGSRVASASRAMRRLTRLEHRALFSMLADRANGPSLSARIERALGATWDKPEELLLRAIDRLLESVQLDRHASSESGRRKRSGKTTSTASRSVVHNKFPDGYLRIAYQPAVLMIDSMDNGLRIECIAPMPPTEESLELELVDEMLTDGESDEDELDAGDETVPAANSLVEGGDGARRSRRERAREEARIQLDGREWIPVQEGSGEGELVAIRIDEGVEDDEAAIASITSNRHVSEHVRRHRMAHGLSRGRLTVLEARALLAGLLRQPRESEMREVWVGVAASLALGRSLEDVARLQIHAGPARPGLPHERIHYMLESQQWILPSPPPAWADMQKTSVERVQWQQLFLYDKTGFHKLLAHFDLGHEGEILKVLKKVRMKSARTIISELLPRADATPAQCAGFLFHRLLATGNGDLGIARQITGRDHSHSASVHHYAHYPASRIWKAYADAWDPTWTPRRPLRVNPDEGGLAAGFGAKRVPKVEAVRQLLQGLQRLMASGSCAQRHNAYTAYTLVGMVLGLGVRPVVEPVIRNIADIEEQGLLITYLDKARTDYHRRINAVPPTLERHLLRYADYLEALRRKPLLRARAPIFFMYIDPQTGAPARFQPSHFKGLVEAFFPLELYAMRRFARTNLREVHDVPGEDVDAFMGHWLHQISPHDRLSTYPMRRLRELADGAVEAMLESVGFVSCELVP